ncbi:MAG TPA: protein translocase subunit SecD [Vicinamibacterales bacterium]|nr:protein translocase subunit SecD [Vicinamibacterales bacterium]
MRTNVSRPDDARPPRAAMINIRKRLLVIAAVMALSLWAIFPPGDKIKLGLDLNGGVHLVLRVKTDDALRMETQVTAERLRNALTEARIAFARLETAGPAEFRVEGAEDGPAFRRVAAGAAPSFERVTSGGTHTFRIKPAAANDIRTDTVQQALHTVERRVNELGVAEPVVMRYSGEDRILVQLPGVTDVQHAKQIIKSTVQLRLTLVERGPFPNRAAALQAYGHSVPTELEVLPGPSHGPGADTAFYVVREAPAVTGSDLRDARASLDEFNRPAVSFSLKPDAAERFGAFTERNVNRALATVLDDRVTSVATILSRIDDQGQITGLSREEMIEQVINFKSGALPADLEYIEEHTVGASLGEASIRSGVLASIGGLTLVMLFMLAHYRLTGLNALMSIVLNLFILVAIVAYIPVPLTLPGIAGLILTIGMGVDSNVLIFERIKEELAQNRSARAAVRAGFDRVWITIVDTHVTSLIAAAFLYQFGTSPIRGFATTLTIGLVVNVFTAVFASRTLFELVLRRGGRAPLALGIFSPSRLFTKTSFPFSRWGRHAIVLSVLLAGAAVATMATKGLPLGIDFAGGTLGIVEFAEQGATEDDVRAAVAPLPGDEVVQRYGPADERRFLVRVPLADQNTSLEAGADSLTQALKAADLPAFQIVDRQLVSAVIGEDLQQRGIYATVASIAAITMYIGIRFRFSFAIGAIAATFHDILLTLACLSAAGYDLSLNVTAALLAVIGYSVNDTIVIFDRVRENMKTVPAGSVAAVVDLSVNQTLSRTFITAGTTLLSVLSLYLFGGEALRGFAFTMLVGIASGTYSTVFVASGIAALLGGRRADRSTRDTTVPAITG